MRSRIAGCCENMTTLGRLFDVVEVDTDDDKVIA